MDAHEFQRVAIVNRGEAAMRFIHAAREFSQEREVPLRTIALFTEPDHTPCSSAKQTRHFLLVYPVSSTRKLGDPKQLPGPWPARAGTDGEHADAVWAGWGAAAEHAGFADLCRR